MLDAASALWAWMPGRARFAVLHAVNPGFMVGVVGVVRDGEGRVLVLNHRFRAPHPWGLPGGFIGRGERLDEALARELREELGATARVLPDILDTEYNVRGGYISIALAAELDARSIRLTDDEILEARFIDPTDMPAGMYPYHEALIRRLAPK